ncbi:hypothetical protein PF001_g33382 [Phytophthora fragariae]|uniref:Uncharacterized protein n=1 Tax=Phytophthora fragariae TaxID=53985 RepID=A0A6A4AIF3_9STRA|nr:hypothetical protein PF001_g33382 [Phytophthora fragariae]
MEHTIREIENDTSTTNSAVIVAPSIKLVNGPTLLSSILMAITVAGEPSTEMDPNMSAIPN